jgi:hypothetical protein
MSLAERWFDLRQRKMQRKCPGSAGERLFGDGSPFCGGGRGVRVFLASIGLLVLILGVLCIFGRDYPIAIANRD